MKTIFVLVFLFIVGSLQGQDYRRGFIVKENGDSVVGFIENNRLGKNSRICYFKESREKKREVFTPELLRGFGIYDYKRYKTKTISLPEEKKEKVFMEIIVDGRASLYLFIDTFYFEKDILILLPPPVVKNVKVDGRDLLKHDTQYISLLNIAMADCGLKADQTPYDEKNLVYLIQNFNRCLGSAGDVIKVKQPWTLLSPYILTGFDKASENLSGFENYSLKPSVSIPAGVGVDISAPKINDKMHLSLELWYLKQVFQGYQETTSSNTTTRTDLFLHSNFLKGSIGFKYHFLQENGTPYFNTGVSGYFLSSFSGTTITETETSGTVLTHDSDVILDLKTQVGVWVGAGYLRRLNHFASAFAEIRFEKNNGFTKSAVSFSSGSALNILFGLKF